MPGLESSTDDPLAIAFQQGSEEAIRAVYEAHGSLIYSFCRRTLPDDRARDVTQEVFVSAWKAHERFDPERGTLAGWLVGIAKNRIIDNHRAERRHASRRSSVEALDVPIEPEIDLVGDRMLVAESLGTLPERSRKVIRLAYIDGFTHQQIADHTGIAIGTVKSDIHRGLQQIRWYLGEAS